MLAPIIPGINSHEIMQLAKTVSEYGASSMAFTVVRLNGAIGSIFTDWIQKTLPNKAAKVLHQIQECHGGTLNDSRFGLRNRGRLARNSYFKDKRLPELNKKLHEQYKDGQLKLF